MFITIIAFLAVFSLLVFAHELGHFWAAKKFGVKAEEFGFGYPPRILGFYKSKDGKKKHVRGNKEIKDAADTIWSLNWIPLGGFVKIKGEDGDEGGDNDSFGNKPIWQRAVILAAGVFMNVVLAFVLFAVCFMIGAPQVVDQGRGQVQIMQVLEDSPAQQAGVGMGDVIVSINGNQFTEVEEVQSFVDQNTGQQIIFELQRGKNIFTKEITPELSEEGRGVIGVALSKTNIVSYPWYKAIWESLKYTGFLLIFIIKAFYQLLTGGLSLSQVAGPVGIAQQTGHFTQLGFVYLLQFTGLLSANLAVINFLPIPGLDGGRCFFLIIEKIRGRKMKQELEASLNQVFLTLLMLLVLVVTVKEVVSFF